MRGNLSPRRPELRRRVRHPCDPWVGREDRARGGGPGDREIEDEGPDCRDEEIAERVATEENAIDELRHQSDEAAARNADDDAREEQEEERSAAQAFPAPEFAKSNEHEWNRSIE